MIGNVDTAGRQLAEVIAELLRPAIVEAIAGEVRRALEAQTERGGTSLKLLSVAEAADLAGVHPETIRRAIRRGDLSAVTSLGRRPRIRPEDLEQFLTPAEESTGS